MAVTKPLADRFWSKVDRSGEHWLWLGSLSPYGYGRFWQGGCRGAHRVAYELAQGAIPDGLQIDHVCGVRACVRPAHLRLATQKQNSENRYGDASRPTTSRYRGVTRDRNRWRAAVGHHGRLVGGGTYATEEEAAEAARQLRNRLFTYNDKDRT